MKIGEGLSGCSLVVIGLALAPAVHGQTASPQMPVPNAPASAANDMASLRTELAEARALLAQQNEQIAQQKRRLDLLEQRLGTLAAAADTRGVPSVAAADASSGNVPIRVGEPPADADRAPTVAVLDQQGSVVTRKGQLIAELGFDYTRADRNRAIFRGISIPEAVLIGIFDISESRQDIMTASASVRYGLTDRLEIGVRAPFVYRSDKLVKAPITADPGNESATIDESTKGAGIGDIELTARYQINNGGHNTPFLIAALQAAIPTGRDPFSVRRNSLGAAEQVSTGAGFWGITPSLTAILPSEPAVLFGTIGYTYNLARNVKTMVPPVYIDRVEPGQQINISAGVGLALNERTSLNFGYNHAWAFGTTSVVRGVSQKTGKPEGDRFRITARDLQIGRFLFGVSHRFSDLLQVNWTVEVGATEDAPDVRTSLRLPFVF